MSGGEIEKKQEVRITDIRMPFSSMVLFMVKWAVASIPALIILTVLGTLLWGIAIGVLSSMRTAPQRAASAPTGTAPQGTVAANVSQTVTPASSANARRGAAVASSLDAPMRAAEEKSYVGKLQIADVRASEDGPKVFGNIKNTGDRILQDVEIILDCTDSDGNLIFEKESRSDVSEDYPLEPDHWGKFTVPALDQRRIAPPNWRSGKLKARVTRVQFR
jgi:hypothetical protein